jgi:MFS family permease
MRSAIMERIIGKDSLYIKEKYPEYYKNIEFYYKSNFMLIILDSSFFSFSTALLSQDTILPFFIKNLTNSLAWIGLVPAIYYLGYYAPQLFGAYLIQGRSTRKWIIFWIAVAERIGIMFIALVAQTIGRLPSNSILALFLMAYSIFTITNGLIGPAYADFISKNIVYNRGLFYGFMNWLGGIIGFGASLTAKYIIDRLDYPHNLQSLFWLCFAASFISPFIIASFHETPFPEVSPSEPFSKFIYAIPRYINTYPQFMRFLITRSIVGLAFMANAFYAIYAVKHYDLDPGIVGVFTMIILFARSGMGFIWGWIGDHKGYKYVLMGASLLLGLEAALALLVNVSWVFYLIMFCVGGVYASIWIYDPNMVFRIAPPKETSRFIGTANTLLGPIMAIAPIIGGMIVDNISYEALFMVAFGLSAVGFVATIFSVDGIHSFYEENHNLV